MFEDFKLRGKVVLDGKPFSEGLDRLKEESKGFTDNLAVQMAGAMTVTNLAIKGMSMLSVEVQKAVQEYMKLETGIQKVKTLLDQSLMSGATFRQELLRISEATGIFATELAEASYQALSAGVSTQNLTGFIEDMTILTKGGFTDITTAVDVTTSIMNGYGKSVYSVEEISDKLIQTQNLGKTTVNELGKALYNVIPTASALGVSLDDVLGGLALITASGTPTAVATTQMRQVLLELSDEAKGAGKQFKILTGESFRDFIARGGDVATAINVLDKGATEAGVPITQLFSSVEAGAGVTILASESVEKFTEKVDGIKKSSGEAEKANKIATDNMEVSWGRLGNKISTLFLDDGGLFPLLNKGLIAFANSTVDIFDDTFKLLSLPGQLWSDFVGGGKKAREEIAKLAEIKKAEAVTVEKKEVEEAPTLNIVGKVETQEQKAEREKAEREEKKRKSEAEKKAREEERARKEAWRKQDQDFREETYLIEIESDTMFIEKDLEFYQALNEAKTNNQISELEFDELEQEYKFEKEQAIYEQNNLELERQLDFYANKEEYALEHAETMQKIKENELNNLQNTFRREEAEKNKSFNVSKNLENLKETLMRDSFNFMVKQNGNVLKNMGNFLVQSAANAAIQAGSEIFYDGLKLTLSGGKNIVKGIAISANPLTPGLGAPLIAAGGAEVAKGAGNIAIASALGFAGSVASSSGGSGGGSDSGFSLSGQGSEEAEKTSQQIEKDKTVTIYTDGDVKNVLLGMMTEFDKLAKDYDIINVVSR